MARFNTAEWAKITPLLDTQAAQFGYPERRADSVVLSSFNIRKIGSATSRNGAEWKFLADYCRRCDLIAVQEVQDNLAGLNRLKQELGDKYGLAASDITGARPGVSTTSSERLAFLFRWDRVKRTEVAADLTFDRSAILDTLYDKRQDFADDFGKRKLDLEKWEKKRDQKLADWVAAGSVGKKPKSPKKPPFVLSNFLTFIRTPYCVSFEIPGAAGAKPYRFLAVSAHLLYGDKSKQKEEREREFFALIEWLLWRASNVKNMYHKDIILFGDLNLDFEEVDPRRERIEEFLTTRNLTDLNSLEAARLNFPFLDIHPSRAHIADPNEAVFRSTARLTQTYDQIGLVIDDKRLPNSDANATAGTVKDGFDYGVANFTDLFAKAIHNKAYGELSDSQKKILIKKYEHKISDHLPIWIRLPLPG